MSILDLIRPELKCFRPYASARRTAPKPDPRPSLNQGNLWLNANELPWDTEETLSYNRYPEPQPAALRQRLAQLWEVTPEHVLLTRGSDEAIDLLIRSFCRPYQDAVLVTPPTFGMYAVSAALQAAEVIRVDLETPDFELASQRLLTACDPRLRLVFLCSPGNPTGRLIPLAQLEALIQALRGRALVVVDEAYLEFARLDNGQPVPSATCLLEAHENLAVLRTLSKAWGLAGLRLGAVIARPELISLLGGIQAPYPLPRPAIEAALSLLGTEREAWVQSAVRQLIAERERLFTALYALPGVRQVLPSQANFLTVSFSDSAQAMEQLLAAGIVVRDLSDTPGLEGALRISLGRPEDNDRVLAALGSQRTSAEPKNTNGAGS